MSPTTRELVGAIGSCLNRTRPRCGADRHPMTRDETRWYRTWDSHRPAFGNPDAARVATLAVFDIDLMEHRSEAPR